MLLEEILRMLLDNPRQNIAKIKFPNKEEGAKGFGIIRRSGYAVDCYENNIFGLTSEEQLKLLDENKITYEKIN